MTEYTASNGYQIELSGGAGYVRNVAGHERHVFGRYTVEALREFFQHLRDEELGRWRWPENPDYVVYPAAVQSRVRVFRETGMGDLEWVDRGDERSYEFCHAARAYFEAHPERKPWEDAKPGEVWLFRAKGDVTPSAFMKSYDGWTNSAAVVVQRDPVLPYGGSRDESFDPRRIWPEDAS